MAGATCGVPVVIKALADRMEAVANRDMRTSRDDRQVIDGLLVTWKRHNESTQFVSSHAVRSLPALNALVAEAEGMLDGAATASPNRVRLAITALRSYDESACEDARVTGGGDAGSVLDGDRDAAPERASPPPSNQNVDQSLGMALSILMALILVIALIVLSRWAYNLMFSLTYNRRSCYIYATIEFDLDVVDGAITILGRKGFRFKAVNDGAHHRFDMLRPGDDVFVVVGDDRFPAHIEQFRAANVGIFFNDHLTWREQRRLLRASLVSPHLAPKPAFVGRQREGTNRATRRTA